MTRKNDSLLLDAVRTNDLKKAEYQIKNGADLNCEDILSPYRHTPLMTAAREGNLEMIKLLAEHGAILDKKSITGFTALSEAAWFNRIDVVNVLLELGARPDIPNNEGNTALSEAARLGHAELVSLLLKHGASPFTKNNDNLMPVDLTRNPEIKSILLSRYSVLRRLSVWIKSLTRTR